MCKRNVEIKLNDGLNLLNYTRLGQAVSRFKANVLLRKEKQMADASNIIELLSLGIAKGEMITVVAQGKEEREVVSEIENLLKGERDE